jgi:hypothetical protein
MSGYTYTYERKVPTAAQREARKAFKEADAKVGMSEYEMNALKRPSMQTASG